MQSQEREDEQESDRWPEYDPVPPMNWAEKTFWSALLIVTLIFTYLVVRGVYLAAAELWRLI